jgi:hypothetical protein
MARTENESHPRGEHSAELATLLTEIVDAAASTTKTRMSLVARIDDNPKR